MPPYRFCREIQGSTTAHNSADQYTDLRPSKKLKSRRQFRKTTFGRSEGHIWKPLNVSRMKIVNLYEQSDIEQLDFEFVLFASALIDYDYIMV